jgi:hypothetical protein
VVEVLLSAPAITLNLTCSSRLDIGQTLLSLGALADARGRIYFGRGFLVRCWGGEAALFDMLRGDTHYCNGLTATIVSTLAERGECSISLPTIAPPEALRSALADPAYSALGESLQSLIEIGFIDVSLADPSPST